jgi:Domain of unknown function (DUF5615)
MVRFLLDAGLSPRLVQQFADEGHDAIHHDELLPARSSDATVIAAATDTGRVLITRDFDFADPRGFEPRRFAGVVVLTVPRHGGPRYIAQLVRELLMRLPEIGDLRGKLLIVEPGRIRVRE